MDWFLQFVNVFKYIFDLISSLYGILLLLLLLFVIHIFLYLIKDRKYIKIRTSFIDPEEIKLEDLIKVPLVNIIIPAWKEGENFRNCLKSITKLRYPKLNIIVNAGGSEETIKIADSFKKYDNFTIIYQGERGGKIKALNDCLPYIANGLIYMVDADVYIVDEVLLRIVYPLINLNEQATMSGHRPLRTQENKDFIKYIQINQQLGLKQKFQRYSRHTISGANGCITFDVIKVIGKFTENRMVAEDLSRGMDIKSAGFKIFTLSHFGSFIYSAFPNNLKEYFLQRIRWNQNRIKDLLISKKYLLIKHFFLFFISIYIIIAPLLVFLHPAFLILGLIMYFSMYLKRMRRVIFYKKIRSQKYRSKLGLSFYLKVCIYLYLELIVNIYTIIDYIFFKKNFRKRRNL